jgi:hypothetical protein
LLLNLFLPLQILTKRDPVDLYEPDRDDREGHRKRQVHRHGSIQLQIKKKERLKPSADHDRSDRK